LTKAADSAASPDLAGSFLHPIIPKLARPVLSVATQAENRLEWNGQWSCRSSQFFIFSLSSSFWRGIWGCGRGSWGLWGRGSVGVEAALVCQLIEGMAGFGQALDVG